MGASGCAGCTHEAATLRSPLGPACLVAAGRDIRGLKLDYFDLAQLAPRGTGAMSTRVGGSADPGTPISLAVDTLQRDIAWHLVTWEPPVREAAGLRPERVRAVRAGWAVSTAVDVIAPRVDVLAALGPTWGYAAGLDAGPVLRDGLHAVATLRALHRSARSVLGLTRLVHALPGQCSGCSAEALCRENGSETVWCGNCDQASTWDDYRRYVGLILAAPDTSRI